MERTRTNTQADSVPVAWELTDFTPFLSAIQTTSNKRVKKTTEAQIHCKPQKLKIVG